MNLLKIFTFSGIFQNGRRMDAPLGSFRRFTNAYKDDTGRIKPFGTDMPILNAPTGGGLSGAIDWSRPIFSAIYRGGVFQLIRGSLGLGNFVGGFRYFRDPNTSLEISQVFSPTHTMNLNLSAQYCPASNFTSVVVNQKLFFNEYVNQSEFDLASESFTRKVAVSNLLKFDGIQVAKVGLPTPYSLVDHDAAGTVRYRTVYFTLGLDAELVFSNYVDVLGTIPSLSANKTFYLGGYTDAALTTRRTDSIGAAGGIFPEVRQAGDYIYDDGTPQYQNRKWLQHSMNGADLSFISLTGVVLANCVKGSPNLAVGDWLLCIPRPGVAGFFTYTAFYVQLKAVLGTTYTFDSKIKRYNSNTVSWEDYDLENGMGNDFRAVMLSHFSNIQALVSRADGTTGAANYETLAILPILWDSNVTQNVFMNTTTTLNTKQPVLGVITQFFSDFYDSNVVKTTFPPVIGITNYSGLLVGFDAVALYFHDTSLGGSSEMVSGISNLVPYGSEFGDIVAACGSETFLFLSRERKNYVITGELTTGQVNITECDEAVAGAANAKAVSNAFSDKVVFMNSTGIYEVSSSGSIKKISSWLNDLFVSNPLSHSAPNDGNLFKKECFKSAAQKLSTGFDGGLFKISLEENRGFILFLTGHTDDAYTRNLVQSNVLVLDTKDGSWYEFYGEGAFTVEAPYGKIMLLSSNTAMEGNTIRGSLPVPEQYQMLLLTQRITMGMPSIEKQANQLKFYGNIDQGGKFLPPYDIKIGQQNGFGGFAGIDYEKDLETYVNYPNADTAQFSAAKYTHKQRLDSSKPQAMSILFKTKDGELLTLEGIEIEIDPIQAGMKK